MAKDEGAPEVISRLSLRSLGLKPGMAMQTRRLVEGARKMESQFCGAMEGHGVMVGPLGGDGAGTGLVEGDVCVVRGCTGQYEYSFVSKVLQTFEKPFVYALLAYPTLVDARLVRQSMRTPFSWPAAVLTTQPDGRSRSAAVSLIDLSMCGAMIKSAANLAPRDSDISLSLAILVNKAPVELYLNARICHTNRATYEDAYFTGMAFKQLTPHDRLVLSHLTQTPSF